METDPDLDAQRAEAFGRAFAPLMARLTREYESVAARMVLPGELEQVRRTVAGDFQAEAEELIERHQVPGEVAEYVRHVVREGFEADFDPLDPTEVSLQTQAARFAAGVWTVSAPDGPGAYALKHPAPDHPVELARFDRDGTRWLVQRWGASNAAVWSELERQGWKRWSSISPTPPA